MSAAKRAQQSTLPKSATIIIKNQQPAPCGEVEVTPDAGRIIFQNKDKRDYRLRFFKPDTDPSAGIDILLAAGGRTTVLIKKNDEFLYKVLNVEGDEKLTGPGGGPIKN
jgi:hypothetical protein